VFKISRSSLYRLPISALTPPSGGLQQLLNLEYNCDMKETDINLETAGTSLAEWLHRARQ
jgi:hypothetical protein